MSNLVNVGVLAILLTLPNHQTDEFRTWTDSSGKFSVEAKLLSADSEEVKLETKDGKTISVPIGRLSGRDKAFLKSKMVAAPENETQGGDGPGKVEYSDVSELSRILYHAEDVHWHLEAVINNPQSSEGEIGKAKRAIEKWQKLADENAIRVGTKWMNEQEIEDAKADGDELLSRAVIAQQSGNFEDAIEELGRLAARDPSRAEHAFYEMGMLYLLAGRTAVQAEPHLHRCVRMLEDELHYQDPSARRNLAAALNNLAVAKLRTDQVTDAIKYLKQSIEMYPFVESKHNLARAAAVAHANFYFSSADSAAPKFREIMLELQVSQSDFVTDWGWKVIPFFSVEPETWYTPEDEVSRKEQIANLELAEEAALRARRNAGAFWLYGLISSGTYLALDDYYDEKADIAREQADYVENRLGYSMLLQRSDTRWAVFVTPTVFILPSRNTGNLQSAEIMLDGAEKSLSAERIAYHKGWDIAAYRLLEGESPEHFLLAAQDTAPTQMISSRFASIDRYPVKEVGNYNDFTFYRLEETPEEISAKVLIDANGAISQFPVERVVDPRDPTLVASVSSAEVRKWLTTNGVNDAELNSGLPIKLTDTANYRIAPSLYYLKSEYPVADGLAIAEYGSSSMNDPWCFFCRGTELIDCGNCLGGVDTQEVFRTVTRGGMSIQIKEAVKVKCSVCSGKGKLPCKSPICKKGVQVFNAQWLAPLPR